MPIRKNGKAGVSRPTARAQSPAKSAGRKAGASSTTSSARSTQSGPARSDLADLAAAADAATTKMEGTQALAARMPHNANKAAEHGKLRT